MYYLPLYLEITDCLLLIKKTSKIRIMNLWTNLSTNGYILALRCEREGWKKKKEGDLFLSVMEKTLKGVCKGFTQKQLKLIKGILFPCDTSISDIFTNLFS